ncbi:glycosyltransferase [Pseudovibrio brasiliensis]|uniref:Glycosyltransferase n=1 Tax=Pseudovibrio brasiliensis TaxID=1898042 RepID=A0ABX8AV41_9HYPH|nr:glycosyltransferase [Pseudovibrio brasiliensis]QUS58498.1 glycosyltransferase [Pseudovibrio brasiliensis]
MRILLLTGGFGVTSETFIYDRAFTWVKQGHEVRVVTLKRLQPDQFPFDDVVELRRPNLLEKMQEKLQRHLGMADVVKYAKVYRRQVEREIKQFQPNKVHAEFGNIGALATPLCKRLNVPLSVFMHAFDITELPRKDLRWRDAYQKMFTTAEVVHTPSQFMRQKVVDLGAPEDLVKVTHNGIDVSKWRYTDPSQRFDGENVHFLFVGRLVEKKGPLQLLEAFKKCREELPPSITPHLTVCGSGPLEQRLKEEINASNLSTAVQLMGSCSHDEVKRYMSQAHILVQHSITTANGDMEGLPVSLTEAAACGLPIVSTVHSGIPEIVRHNVNGFLTDEKDIDTFSQYMALLAREPLKWQKMGLAGRQLVEDDFNISKIPTIIRK